MANNMTLETHLDFRLYENRNDSMLHSKSRNRWYWIPPFMIRLLYDEKKTAKSTFSITRVMVEAFFSRLYYISNLYVMFSIFFPASFSVYSAVKYRYIRGIQIWKCTKERVLLLFFDVKQLHASENVYEWSQYTN